MSVRRLIAPICAALALPFLPVPPSVAAGSAGPMVIHGTATAVRVTASAAGYLPVTVTTRPTARVTTRPSIEALSMARARTEPAASGRITGSVKPVPKSRQGLFAAQARISRLDVPGSLITSTVSRRGTFAAKVPAGLYSVVGVGHGAKKPAARVDVLRVRAGKTVTLGGRAAASSLPQPIRISVGTFTNRTVGSGADGAYFVAGLSDLSLSDLILSTEDCRSDVGIFEDRQGPRWNEILGELKFQTSKYVDADTRRKARAALKNLPKYAPTHRVTATVTAVSSAGARADFRLVNLKSGRIEWSHAMTVAGDPFGVADQAMDILAEELCAPPGPATPQTLTGTFSGSVVTSRYTLSWTGTLAKEFLAKDPHTGFLYRDSAHYRTTNAAVTWKAEGTCNGSGTLGNTELLNAFPDTTIAWNRTTPGWGYETFLGPNAGTRMMVQCPQTGDHPPPPENAAYLVGLGGEGALLYNSDSRGTEANRFSPDLTAFDGTLSINAGNPQTWAWDITGAGVAEVPEQ